MGRRPFLAIASALLIILGSSVVVLGFRRYGGPQGLILRVRAEFGLEETRNPYVPTPLPTPTPRPTETHMVRPSASPTLTDPPPTAMSEPSATPNATSTTREALVPTTVVSAATWTCTATPTTTPTLTPTLLPIEDAVVLSGLRHEWQTWNNCGPATLSMYLSYYGSTLLQENVREVIRPNWEDKHANLYEMAEFARSQGLNALVRVNGDADRLRLLLSNGVPVMVATWHIDEKGEQMGHYRLLTGYDDTAQEWILWDSLEKRGVSANKPYEGVRMSYEELERFWPVYNRIYLLLYDDEHVDAVQGIIGEDLDDATMWRRALEDTEAWLSAEPENAFAWFTLGTNLLHNGRPKDAAATYDQARLIGLPYRMMWYQFGPLEAYYAVGRYDEVIALADATIQITSDIEELHYWRGLALEAKGDVAGARAALRTALEKKANYEAARAALASLGE